LKAWEEKGGIDPVRKLVLAALKQDVSTNDLTRQKMEETPYKDWSNVKFANSGGILPVN